MKNTPPWFRALVRILTQISVFLLIGIFIYLLKLTFIYIIELIGMSHDEVLSYIGLLVLLFGLSCTFYIVREEYIKFLKEEKIKSNI